MVGDAHQQDRWEDLGLGSLQRETAPEQITGRLLSAVAAGVLYEGERLPPERELAEICGVSRNTLRQAVSRLSALGVIESRRGRNGGSFVKSIGDDPEVARAVRGTLEPIWGEMQAALDYRSLIQQLIARIAAERHTTRDRTTLSHALTAYQAATTPAASREADHHLHAVIADAAGNIYLSRLGQQLVTTVNLGFHADPYSQALRDTALAQHRSLVEAIMDREADRAAAIAADHFSATTAQPWRGALNQGLSE